jgi:hypothetical protein
MADAAVPMTLLELLTVGGLMGLLGQGARAVVGLKGMADNAKARDLTPNDLFEAARLIVSLLIGFLVGLAAALVYFKTNGATEPDFQALIGFAASGYVGVDFLEGFISQYLSQGAAGSKVQNLAASQALDLKIQKTLATGVCGYVKVGAHPPPDIKKLVLLAIQAPASTADETKISELMNPNTGNPIWVAAIQCMNYGQFATDKLTPMPIYFNTNGGTVGGFVKCIECCYAHPQSS